MQLVDSLAGGNVEHEVKRVILAFLYLGCVSFVAKFLEAAMFMLTGARFSENACMMNLPAS